MRVKIMATLLVDPEEYPVPSDGDVTEDFEDYIKDKNEIKKLKKLTYYSNLAILIVFLFIMSMFIIISLGDYFLT